MGIQRIVPQHVRDTARGCIPQKHLAQRKKHRKVEDRGESAVNTVVASHSAREKRRHARIGMKHFSDCRQVWIQPPQSRVPGRPELPAHVGKRVDAVSVQPAGFRPPDAVLHKILFDQRVLRVQVRQDSEEPALRKISFHAH